MNSRPPTHHRICLDLLPIPTAILLDPQSILSLTFPYLKLPKSPNRSPDHCINPIAAHHLAHPLRLAKARHHTIRKQTTSRQSSRRQTANEAVNEVCMIRKALSLPVTRFLLAFRGILPISMTCANTRTPRSRITSKTQTAVNLIR